MKQDKPILLSRVTAASYQGDDDLTYFFILIAAALIAAVSFVFYQQRIIDKKQSRMKKIPALQSSVTFSSRSIHAIPARVRAELNGSRENEQQSEGDKKRNLLVVDDQYAIRMMLSEVFIARGMAVFEADNGFDALEICKSRDLDCILLDLKMPDMDGIEILREIRSISVDVPVVLLTAYASPEKMNEAIELGISNCFTKPFDILELQEEIARTIDERQLKITG
ncbi:response regulator [Candidatus Pristimantibacillus sp. PTI5]|uniref:response regulator n=1 Tax=Candidatus Pristimantibacillus sp. PTI5 TaxID=3400422 RepID=UPI003B01372C